MSLDIYLEGEPAVVACTCTECYHTHSRTVTPCYYSGNITHNLARMADEAGIYECLWRPKESGLVKANQLVAPLREGLAKLRANPQHFKQFNSSNGWGMYEHFVPFVAEVLENCADYPDASVRASV